MAPIIILPCRFYRLYTLSRISSRVTFIMRVLSVCRLFVTHASSPTERQIFFYHDSLQLPRRLFDRIYWGWWGFGVPLILNRRGLSQSELSPT